jgi:hypothetical protein
VHITVEKGDTFMRLRSGLTESPGYALHSKRRQGWRRDLLGFLKGTIPQMPLSQSLLHKLMCPRVTAFQSLLRLSSTENTGIAAEEGFRSSLSVAVRDYPCAKET